MTMNNDKNEYGKIKNMKVVRKIHLNKLNMQNCSVFYFKILKSKLKILNLTCNHTKYFIMCSY